MQDQTVIALVVSGVAFGFGMLNIKVALIIDAWNRESLARHGVPTNVFPVHRLPIWATQKRIAALTIVEMMLVGCGVYAWWSAGGALYAAIFVVGYFCIKPLIGTALFSNQSS